MFAYTVPMESNLDYPNLGYPNPRLSELQSQAKVQVKVQISGTISICACAVEYSAATVCNVRANDSKERVQEGHV